MEIYNLVILDDSLLLRNLIEKSVINKPKEDTFYDLDILVKTDSPSKIISTIKENKVDIITLDIKMPSFDAIDFIKEIKKLNEDIKIIVISSNFESEYKDFYIKNGAFDYIQKPFQNSYLWTRLDLAARKLKEEKKEDNSFISLGFSYKESIDLKFLEDNLIFKMRNANISKLEITEDINKDNSLEQNNKEKDKLYLSSKEDIIEEIDIKSPFSNGNIEMFLFNKENENISNNVYKKNTKNVSYDKGSNKPLISPPLSSKYTRNLNIKASKEEIVDNYKEINIDDVNLKKNKQNVSFFKKIFKLNNSRGEKK